ncbi:hypothetical protein K438DRAFT_1753256 [Mycena galopus ATCC 62051]|nr:hypothetical protein K438DRAFT_1753256 [Mycena galopus ATCC 62051]
MGEFTAYQHALAMQINFGKNKEAQLLGGHWATAILGRRKGEMVPHCLSWGGMVMATCDDCHDLVITNSGSSQHDCEISQDKKPVSDINFPSLKLLHYLHDVFEELELTAQLDVNFEHFELVRVPVCKVLSQSQNTELMDKELPGLDLTSTKDLYIDQHVKNEVNTEWLEATLAVDTSLHLVSTCPLELSPTLAVN